MSENNKENMKNYRIFIHGGTVFEGSLADYEKTWFVKPDDWTIERFLVYIKGHAEENGWNFECTLVH